MKALGLLALGGLAVVLLAGGAGVVVLEVNHMELANALIDGLPARLGQWGRQLAAAAEATVPAGLEVRQWALFLAGVLDRESGGGTMLVPRGAGGRGDFQDKDNGRGRIGYGLGLMQLDVGAHPGLEARPEQWGDAEWNITRGARELAALMARTGDDTPVLDRLKRAACAYNAGPRALTWNDPDSGTTGRNYGSDVLRRAAGFEELVA